MLSPNADIKVSIFKYSKVNIMKLDIIASISVIVICLLAVNEKY